MLWSKSYVMERERYDGADMVHLLHACGARLTGIGCSSVSEALASPLEYLVLFGFVYPGSNPASRPG